MAFEKIIAPTPRELFLNQIVKMILSGELKPGERLPVERDLAEQMGINRSTVHTGFKELENIGFIRVEPRKGNYVADYQNEGNFNTLTAIAKYGDGTFDDAMRISIVELRNAVVGGAMIRLCKIGTAENFRALRVMHERHRREQQEGLDTYMAARHMLEFNTELVRQSGNAMFLMLFNSFGRSNMPFWVRCAEHWGAETTLKQETVLLDMLEAGKGHEAQQYLENMHENYLEMNSIKR